jgi:hypothetical protein
MKRLGLLLLLALIPACTIIIDTTPVDITQVAVVQSSSPQFSSDPTRVLCVDRDTNITIDFRHTGQVSRWSFRWTYANDGTLRDYREFTASSREVEPSGINQVLTNYTIPAAPLAAAPRPSIVVEAPMMLQVVAYSPDGSSDTFTKTGYKETPCN